mmetsp:Transcript_27279/g.42377  ORF Transcript_27279/g.42377 Transcript_27279/m.42377 type:complete len:204 (+) Transcript_27279:188-799(+)
MYIHSWYKYHDYLFHHHKQTNNPRKTQKLYSLNILNHALHHILFTTIGKLQKGRLPTTLANPQTQRSIIIILIALLLLSITTTTAATTIMSSSSSICCSFGCRSSRFSHPRRYFFHGNFLLHNYRLLLLCLCFIIHIDCWYQVTSSSFLSGAAGSNRSSVSIIRNSSRIIVQTTMRCRLQLYRSHDARHTCTSVAAIARTIDC